jgi:hypothetical protein
MPVPGADQHRRPLLCLGGARDLVHIADGDLGEIAQQLRQFRVNGRVADSVPARPWPTRPRTSRLASATALLLALSLLAHQAGG